MLIDPKLVEVQPMFVSVETSGTLTAGRTVCDVHGVTGHEPNAKVGMKLDKDGFLRLLLDAISSYGGCLAGVAARYTRDGSVIRKQVITMTERNLDLSDGILGYIENSEDTYVEFLKKLVRTDTTIIDAGYGGGNEEAGQKIIFGVS